MTHSANTQSSAKSKSKLFLIGMPILIIIIGLIGFVGMASMAQQPEKKPTTNLATLVDVVPMTPSDITLSIATQGTIVPRTETITVSEVSGMVLNTSNRFKVGGFFKKGDVLLEIDPITYDVALLEAQARLESKQAELIEQEARAKQAEEEWGLTGRTLQEAPVLALRLPQLKKAQAEVKAAKADLKEAQIKLAKTRIIAPYDSIITEKYVDIGQFVSTNSQLAKLIAVDYAEVRLPIKQKDIHFIDLPKINAHNDTSHSVIITSTLGNETLSWHSFITRYEGVVNDSSRVHYLVAQINDPYNLFNNEQDEELRIGMFVKANVKGKTLTDVIKLPRTALYAANKINTITDDNKLDIINVDVVRSDTDFIYIRNNIKTNHRLILTKISTAVQGMSLRVKGESEPQDKTLEQASPESIAAVEVE